MADGSSTETSSSSQAATDAAESTVEINVKTLDSRVFTFRVNKKMRVLTLKEKVAEASGVSVAQQRLIFRGRVLKDDDVLSEYHVEDGHTLHLVARQPVHSQSSAGASLGDNAANSANQAGNDTTGGGPRGRVGQVSHGLLFGTINVGDQGEAIVPDLSRIIGSVLNSMGIGTSTAGGPGYTPSATTANPLSQASQSVETGSTQNAGGSGQTRPQMQTGSGHPFQSVQIPLTGVVAVPSLHMAIPDSLTTISEFISRMELALSINDHPPSASPVSTRISPTPDTASANAASANSRRLPTPEALGSILQRAQQLISGQAAPALSHMAEALDRERNSNDPTVRSQLQSEAVHLGMAMQHLGALFLELGRTVLTLRMGRTPAEAMVNAGPAVYISPSGPNPIMVQPFPLQTSSLFGASSAGPVSASRFPGATPADATRQINIHIHAGTSAAAGSSSLGSRVTTGQVPQGGQPNQESGSLNENTSGNTRSGGVLSTGDGVPIVQSETSNNSGPAEISGPGSNNFVQPGFNSTSQVPSESTSVPSVLTSSSMEIASSLSEKMPCVSSSTPVWKTDGALECLPNVSRVVDDGISQISSHNLSEGQSNISTDSSASQDTSSSQTRDEGEGDRTIPIGLGLGGLQPKRRSKTMKSQEKDAGSQKPLCQEQLSISRGQQVLQSLLSQNSNANEMDANRLTRQRPPIIGQNVNDMPSTGSEGNRQINASNLISQIIQSPVVNNMMTGLSEQTGIGSPADLTSMLEQLTQSPSVMNTLNQITQQVEGQSLDLGDMFSGFGGQQGGMDFSRMIQQMMPVVSQALGRVSNHPTPGQQPPSHVERAYGDDERNVQVDVDQIVDRMERHDSPVEIFHSVVESAGRLSGLGNDYEDLLVELSNDQQLAVEYVEMINRDLRGRLGHDS
ncbi:hypothetical protein QJS04_geneDACA009705 [Acorus gramineus]|uniref:Ubiquitin-like domain-containing protein n=1 Tax=Acorus gramineus TaxID=55184 RepID=A0AAV9BA93_ACOGR|nr:hypothetical protein QJS04_geneDACA009705 [Acorus gramineus]